jgi:hypothetical protein
MLLKVMRNFLKPRIAQDLWAVHQISCQFIFPASNEKHLFTCESEAQNLLFTNSTGVALKWN